MVLAVAKALEDGARSVICASTGNTSASAAAYAAAAGLECVVVLPAGKIAVGKLLQALVVRRARDRGRRQLRRGAARRPRAVRAGRAPGHAGQLGQPVPPRGPEDRRVRGLRRPRPGAGRARDPGRQRRQHQRLLARLPRVPRGRAHRRRPADVGLPGRRRRAARRAATRWSTPRPSRPRSGSATRPRGRSRSRRATSRAGGSTRSPTTRSSRRYRDLARLEGVFCEPSSAASRGGRREGGRARASSTPTRRVVCVLTGNGLKDPTTAEAGVTVEVVEAEPSVADVSRALGWW